MVTAGGYDPHSLIRTKLGGMNDFDAAAKEADTRAITF
jgi:hypothetical protein